MNQEAYNEVQAFIEQVYARSQSSPSETSSLCSYSTMDSLNSSRYSVKEIYEIIAKNANNRGVQLAKMPKRIKKMVKVVAPLLWIQVRVGLDYRRALLDTGAAINMISEEMLSHLPHEPLGKYAVRIKGVTGTSVDKDRWYLVETEFQNGEVIPVPFLVGTPDGIDMILGMPFIKQTRAVIDARVQMIYTDIGDYAFGELSREKTIKLPIGAYPALVDLSAEQVDQLNKVMESAILSTEAAEKIKQKLIDVHEIWTRAGYGHAKGVQFEFKLSDNRPISMPPRHIPQTWHQPLDDEMDKMIRDEVVETSISPYCTYPVLAAKKDGGIRFAIDYRRLNNVTIKDKTPLPRLEDLIAAVEGSKYFALLDLRGGFWHIPIHPAQKHFTAFRTHRGLYQFRVMAFGLVNGPATFQRWMENIFGDLRYQGVLVYIDDILIHAKNEEEFVALMLEVLDRLYKFGACLKLSKCEIAHKEFDYLGHTFEDGIRRPQIKKVECLKRIKDPVDLKGLQSILGMFNFYRLYISNFSDKAKPLTRLLSKNTPFIWGDECRKAVRLLANDLSESVLRVSPTGYRFRLETDASDYAVGATLYDLDEFNTKEHPLPIMFMSKTLNKTEQNWSTAEREAYAIIWALENADPFLRGRQVQVMCDHKNLQWMMSKKAGKIARWCTRLTEYDVEIIYHQGDKNIVADFLSRYIEEDPFIKDSMFCYGCAAPVEQATKKRRRNNDEEDEVVVVIDTSETSEASDGTAAVIHDDIEIPHEEEELALKPWFLEDEIDEPDINEVISTQESELPKPLLKGMFKTEGKWFYMNGVWVPPSLRFRLLDAVHLMPPFWHPRAQRMKRILARLYNWEGLQREVELYVRSCLTCQRTHPGLGITKFKEFKHPMDEAFSTIYVDIWSCSWNKVPIKLVTMVDFHTKWAEAAVVDHKSSTSIAQALLDRWFSRFGPPKLVVNDNERAMVGKALKRLIHILGIKGLQTTIYHPQGNAPVETFHRTLKKYLTNLRPQTQKFMSFNEALAWTLMCYRSLPHQSTDESPAFMTHGSDINIKQQCGVIKGWRSKEPHKSRLSILNEMRFELLRRNQYRARHNQKVNQEAELQHLETGQIVLIQLAETQWVILSKLIGTRKLMPKWSLPMRVLHVNKNGNSATVRCTVSGFTTQVHVNRCRLIDPPATKAMRLEWIRVCEADKWLFKELGSRWFNQEEDKMVTDHV
jgi:transposase InsO family protein